MIDQFKSLTLQSIARELTLPKKTLIIFHYRPDADAIGSAFALRELLRVMGVPVYCVCSDEIPDRLEFLTDGVQGSVVLDDDLKIDYERIISVDSASPSQLGSVFGRLHKDVDIMIDHHAKGTVYADYYIDPDAAATGEIIYELACELIRIGAIEQIPDRVLNCIYAAISADTGSFKYSNTTPKTLRTVADLIERGVDFVSINSALYDSKPFVQLRAEAMAIDNLEFYFDSRVASIIFSYSDKESIGAKDEHLETLIDIARSVEGVEVAFVVKQQQKNSSYRVSMRSVGEIDISSVCAKFGGGGHKRAAGCTIEADSIESAKNIILEQVAKII